LIPENELSKKAGVHLDARIGGPIVNDDYETNLSGIFAAGNVVHVYDLADWVTQAGFRAGAAAAKYAMGKMAKQQRTISTRGGEHVRYVIPHTINPDNLMEHEFPLQLRVSQPIEAPVRVVVRAGEKEITRKNEMYARPGEMISINLQEKHYDALLQADELVVDIVER
jgi:uncharacterized cupredoxin-like copper-binding protein